MTTLLIDQERAEDVFSAIVQAHECLRSTLQVYLAPNWPCDLNDDDNDLAGRVAELEALISQAAKVEQSIPQLSQGLEVDYTSQPVRVGRPAKTLKEKVEQIAGLEDLRQQAKTTQEKLALGKQIRRIRRSIVSSGLSDD